MTSLQNTVV